MLAMVLLGTACTADSPDTRSLNPVTTSTGAMTSFTIRSAPPVILSETVTTVTPSASNSSSPLFIPATTTPPVSIVELSTYAAHSTKGTTVYYNYCAPCHGSTGQGANGPALWQPGGTLGQSDKAVFFANNAAAMLDFISYFMPLYAPGSLSHNDYVDVNCYLLIQSDDVQPMDTFVESQLKNIALK